MSITALGTMTRLKNQEFAAFDTEFQVFKGAHDG